MGKIIHSKYSIYYLLILHFVIWIFVSFHLDIHPDMSDHWVWSRFLDFGYYEHPPMVAWNMRIVTLIGEYFSISEIISLKIGSVLFSTLILYLSFYMGKLFFNLPTGFIFVLLLESTLYFSIGSIFWHIDQFYLVAWLGCMIVMGKFLKDENIKWLYIIGIIAGLGALSKYIMILFYFSIFLYFILNSKHTLYLKDIRFYISGLISLIIFSPVLYWNYKNEWISFKFQFSRGLSGGDGFESFLLFTIGHLALFSLILSPLSWFNFIKKKYYDKNNTSLNIFLFSTIIIPFLFFSASSLKGSISDPHWLNISYFGLYLLFSKEIYYNYIHNQNLQYFSIISLSYFTNVCLIIAVFAQIHFNIFKIPHNEDPLNKLMGWHMTASQIEKSVNSFGYKYPKFIISREYQLSSALALYMKNKPIPHSIEKPERNKWSPIEDIKKNGAIIVCKINDCENTLKKAKNRFNNEIIPLNKITTTIREKVIRKIYIHYLQPKYKL